MQRENNSEKKKKAILNKKWVWIHKKLIQLQIQNLSMRKDSLL